MLARRLRMAGLGLALALMMPSIVSAQETVLRVAGNGDISTLDAHRASATNDETIVDWIYNGLVRLSPAACDEKTFADLHA